MQLADLSLCVQTADGRLSQAVCGSELAAMMIMAVLPDMQQHYLAKGKYDFAMRCRYYELRQGLPLGSVQYPFPIFFDNAPVHAHPRISMAMWWQRNRYALPLQRKIAESLQGLDANVVQPLVDHMRKHDPPVRGSRKSDNELRAAAYATLQTTYAAADSSPYQLHELQRQLNAVAPASAGYPPQMWGPLVDKTPDINSPAENCVCFFKTDLQSKVREFMTQVHMQDAFDWARTYVDVLLAKLAALNTADGLITCRASVLKATARVRLLACDADKCVLVSVVDIRTERAKHGQPAKRYIVTKTCMERGRAGKWAAKGVFKG